MTATFQKESFVAGHPDAVWERVTTFEGINHELRPVMQMTVPRHLKGKGIHEVPLGTPIGRSWLLLFGIIPFDYDKITIAERDHGRRFLEKSTMMSMARWEHERTLEERDGGCLVKDRLTFHLRPPGRWIPGAHRFVAWVLSKLFSHRHRKLQRFFNERKGSQPD